MNRRKATGVHHTNIRYRISSNKRAGAYLKFQGRLLEEGRLIEGALIKFCYQRTVTLFWLNL